MVSPLKKTAAVVFSDRYLVHLDGLEKLHPFDSHKYRRIHQELIREGHIAPEDTKIPEPCKEVDLLRVHTQRYLDSLKNAVGLAEALEFPQIGNLAPPVLYDAIVMPHQFVCGGTLLAARAALEFPISINIGGGYHHAKPDRGGGFCLFADVPIAIRCLLSEGRIKRALIVDLDVHQGNGTAVIFADDERVFTFSMHQKDIYPIPKEFSNCDVELQAGTEDQTYLNILSEHLPKLFELADPDMVFLLAGCDVLKDDPLAGLALTGQGVIRRDWMVAEFCLDRKVPLVMTLAGGYGRDSWRIQYESIRNIMLNLHC